MLTYKNLTILGTSHIAIESIKQVQSVILTQRPEIIAVELDLLRFQNLMTKKKQKLKFSDIRKLGFKGFLFNIIGAYIEKKLGEIVKVSPGSEMKKAITLGIKLKSEIALIDQDIRITLKKLSKSITFKEKLTFIKDILKALIIRKPEITFDLRKVPDQETINKMVKKVKDSYPSVYKILIKERNNHMAKALYKLMNSNKDKKILAIVGAGHEREIINLLKNIKGEPKLKLTLLKPKPTI